MSRKLKRSLGPDPDGSTLRPPDARRGRGAASNAVSRYDRETREIADDGWGGLETDLPPLRTTVTRDATRTIIARNTSPDVGFDRSINPYRGCEHGCIYCFARPTHAFLGLSPGLDFESRLLYKPEAATLLLRELSHPKYRCRTIAMGTNTDPYQPIERDFEITRQILEVLEECNHPVSIVTKSHLITRDLDILSRMAAKGLAKVGVSVTTLDRDLARRMEPRASTPAKRLEALRTLSGAGVPTIVMFAPAIPALNADEMESILEAGKEAGAQGAAYVLLRMPLEIKDLFREWLAENEPDKANRVIRLVREIHGGKDYDATFGKRQVGTGPYADLMRRRFKIACKKLGLGGDRVPLKTDLFKKPDQAGDQLSLF
ncbi:MAG: PA0069 family radical SAM protein [Minwuiales bacterium]|nr:PA0069 family radical SAM protein [Minwuiales bacterium]